MNTAYHRVEVNILEAKDISHVGTLCVKNGIPAVVVPPELVFPARVDKESKRSANYKIISTIDFDNNGKDYALDKIKNLPRDILEADGFDILLSANRNEIETSNEMKALNEFIINVNQLAEIRWTIGLNARTPESVLSILKSLKKYPCAMIRTDNNLVINKPIKLNDYTKQIKLIREYSPCPIKVSGNVDSKMFNHLKDVKFDVSLQQLNNIIK